MPRTDLRKAVVHLGIRIRNFLFRNKTFKPLTSFKSEFDHSGVR
jgi:hypothetical protein